MTIRAGTPFRIASDMIVRGRILVPLLQLNALHRALLGLHLYERYRIYVVALLVRLSSATVKRWLPDAMSALAVTIHDTARMGAYDVSPTTLSQRSR
jgi:hypothetical protein